MQFAKIQFFLLPCYGSLLSVTMAATLPFPSQSLPGVDIGNGLGAGYETSGIVWHSRLERFFAVDDDGRFSSMDVNGNDVTHLIVGLGDPEAVTVADPSSNFVYIGRENSNSILEYDVANNTPTRAFSLAAWMGGPSNSGLEALTFVADANDPDGGLFYAGKQGDGVIYVFRIPIDAVGGAEFQFSFQAAPGRTDLSGLHYDAANDVLYAIWDSSNLLRAMRPDGTFLAEWTLPGTRQEGITFQGNNLLIAQDNGPDAIRYSNFPLIVPEPTSQALCLCTVTLLGARSEKTFCARRRGRRMRLP